MTPTYPFIPGELTLDDIKNLMSSSAHLKLDDGCWGKIKSSRKVVEDIINSNQTVYGINTGFGLLASTRISKDELATLQRNLLLSHAAGVGDALPDKIVKLILLLKINALARGFSGIRPELLDALIAFYNAELYPIVPAKGSVGASGDLAPLAHLCLPLIGEGSVSYKGKKITGREALNIAGLTPVTLDAKEGLALINGTQVSTAIALYSLINAQHLLAAGAVIGGLTVDGAAGSVTPFHPDIHAVRGHPGQIRVAALLQTLLEGSQILDAHKNCDRVQDPYSLRCQPQVLGACLDNLSYAEEVLVREANAVSDNPLVFEESHSILSGGNFHAEPVAQVADFVAIALSEIGAISERKIALLIDPHFNGALPAFLVKNGGINSGFMIAHVTASSLASANKSLSHPASVDSLPTSANQEDHVSMATYAALRLMEIVDNVENILAIELLAASQAIDLRKPLNTSSELKFIIDQLREKVAFWQEDNKVFSEDINLAVELVRKVGEEYRSALFEGGLNSLELKETLKAG